MRLTEFTCARHARDDRCALAGTPANDTIAYERLRLLMSTMTASQVELLGQSVPALFAIDPANVSANLFPESTTPIPSSAGPWYHGKHAAATETEVLLYSVLLTMYYVLPDTVMRNRKELRGWQRRVESDAPRQRQLGAAWAPPPDSIEWNSQGQILRPLEEAIAVCRVCDFTVNNQKAFTLHVNV